jgi:hypothetical protein
MELAIDKAVNRFESLRAVVREDEQGLRIRSYVKPIFDFVDLSSEDTLDVEARIAELSREHVDRSFDFFEGPLVRVRLMRLGPESHRLCLCSSHLVCDGWSTEIVIQAIAQSYTAMIQGRHADLGSPPQLEEFILLEEERKSSEEMKEAKEFWLEEYSDPLPPVLELPLDHPRPDLKTYGGVRQEFQLDPELAAGLRVYAKEHGCTFFTLLLSVYHLLLVKLTGTRDLVVGVPAAGQPSSGLMDLVVHNVNFLPLRTRVPEDILYEDFLRQVRDGFGDAMSNQIFSYGLLLRSLTLPRDPSRLPLVAVGFNVDQEFSPIWFDEAQASFVSTPRSYVKYDLHFNFIDKGEALDLEIDHNASILDSGTVGQWLAEYTSLLEAILSEPDATISKLLEG